jgi:hypothetical protein
MQLPQNDVNFVFGIFNIKEKRKRKKKERQKKKL